MFRVIALAFVFLFSLASLAAGSEAPAGYSPEQTYKLPLYAVQLSLERYAVDHGGAYPQHINQLVLGSYLPGGLDDFRPLHCVPFGFSAGDFTYLQHYNAQGEVDGYLLLGYGQDPAEGKDLSGDGEPDGVVLMLSGGSVFSDQQPDGRRVPHGRPLPEHWLDNGYEITLHFSDDQPAT